MGLAEGAAPLEVVRDIEDGVELVLGPLLGGDHVPSAQVGLHLVLLVGQAPALRLMRRKRSRSSLKNEVEWTRGPLPWSKPISRKLMAGVPSATPRSSASVGDSAVGMISVR